MFNSHIIRWNNYSFCYK